MMPREQKNVFVDKGCTLPGLPDLCMPDLCMPDLCMPELCMPELCMPELCMPEQCIPTADRPLPTHQSPPVAAAQAATRLLTLTSSGLDWRTSTRDAQATQVASGRWAPSWAEIGRTGTPSVFSGVE
jgi:hypothetical protein